MIQHIVLLRWKSDASAEAIRAVTAQFSRLRDVAGVSDLTHGENFAKQNDGYSYALTARIRDNDALKAYWSDPTHKAIMAMMTSILERALVIDFNL